MTVAMAVSAELGELERRDRGLATGSLAALALSLAAMVDDEGNSATSRSMCAARLAEVLREIRELAPAVERGDILDEIGTRRAKRAG